MRFNEATFLIVDHFDGIRNQIDIHIETLLGDNGLNKKDRKSLNDIREKQLEKIDEFQHASLSQLNTLGEPAFEREFAQLINDSSLNYDQKKERVLSRFIFNDLIMIENSESKSKQTLCIVPGYWNKIKYALLLFQFQNYFKNEINFLRDDQTVLNLLSIYSRFSN